eukprot:4598599-Pyramimonas_sp.AAC.1
MVVMRPYTHPMVVMHPYTHPMVVMCPSCADSGVDFGGPGIRAYPQVITLRITPERLRSACEGREGYVSVTPGGGRRAKGLRFCHTG